MRKTKAEAQHTREALLQAALEIFYQRGVAQASLQEIAATAGVTRGALYWHFKNKEDLFDALFQQFFSEMDAQIERDIAAQSPNIWQSLEQAVTHCFYNMEHNESFRKFIYIVHLNCDHTQNNHTIVKLLQKYQNMWFSHLRSIFQICQQQQIIPAETDIVLAVHYFQSHLQGLTDLWLTNPHSINLADIAPRFVSATMKTLRYTDYLQ